MTIESHIIPVSSGLFEHRERIGPAVWEFLWCIDAIQGEEVDDSGERWGLVLDGLPVKHEQIALDIQSSARTVKRNMAILKQEGYISATRVSRGEVIKVRKNKKSAEPCGAKIGTSHERDGPEMAHQSDSDRPKMAHHTAELDECGAKIGTSLPNDRPNLAHHEERKDLKDLKELIKLLIDRLIDGLDDARLLERCGVLTTVLASPIIEIHLDEKTISQRATEMERYFNDRKGRIFPTGTDWVPVQKVAKVQIPMEFILFGIDLAFARKQRDKRWDNDEINSFSYCAKVITGTWYRLSAEIKQILETQSSDVNAAESLPPRKSKQQRELDELDRLREEAVRLGQGRGH
ncbi:MAG: hypothetical protein J7639_24750 [Paenibacillaceae bacterium]|nr:hypothetical protein [Paenibacillaceae bacterium]